MRRPFVKRFNPDIISILLTTFFVTIFELIFFILMIAPTIETKATQIFNKIQSENSFPVIEPNIFELYKIEDEITRTNYNRSVLLDGGYILVLVLIIMYFVRIRTGSNPKNKKIITNSLISAGLFMIFQVYFFIVGKNYNYATDEETISNIEQELIQNL